MVRSHFRFKLLLSLVALVVVVWFARSLWLPLPARLLIRQDGPSQADIAVVLAGDPYGLRIIKGAELARDGFVPAVLVSGPETFGVHESDLAIAMAVRRGFPVESFIPFPNSGLSTKEEAREVLAELQRRKVHRFLLVTSDYHTARAARIYRAMEKALGGGPEMRVVAAPDKHFRADTWWHDREGQKIFFFEWSKTVATAVGM